MITTSYLPEVAYFLGDNQKLFWRTCLPLSFVMLSFTHKHVYFHFTLISLTHVQPFSWLESLLVNNLFCKPHSNSNVVYSIFYMLYTISILVWAVLIVHVTSRQMDGLKFGYAWVRCLLWSN